MRRFIFSCLFVFVVLGAVQAEIAHQRPEELEKNATHIVVGTVRFVGTAEKRDREWLRSNGVLEVKVSEVKKGKRIERGDCVYPRFWHTRWIGQGDPPPYGSGHHVPQVGERVQVFLKQNDGGYDLLLPNGIEVITDTAADAPPAIKPAAQAPAATR